MSNSDDLPVAIHPGMVRTGTSTLQKRVLARHPEIAFFGLPAPAPDIEAAVRAISNDDSTRYDQAAVRSVLRRLDTEPSAKIGVLSHENLALFEARDKGQAAARLKALFPEARVFFTIRRQEDLVVSWYLNKLRNLIKRSAYVPFEEWFWVGAREPHATILDDLAYGPVIDRYAELFGRQNIGIFLFEDLKEDARRYSDALASFLSVDAETFAALMADARDNASMTQSYMDFWRWFGRLVPRRMTRELARKWPNKPGPKARISLADDIAADIRARCAEDNRRLEARYGLSLTRHGYSVASSVN
ncbi:MAG: hypothetical protein AAFY56_14915 [Pseudomonadota bacterium]